jgi:hypothetical protein
MQAQDEPDGPVTAHPTFRAPEQLAALFRHTTLHLVHEPDEHLEQVRGEARALYEALGHRFGEPGHEGADGW